jgi:hypothetical protein
MRYLMHVGKETIFEQVGGIGLFAFPPGEAVEIEDDYLAGIILEHKTLMGLIEVPTKKTKQGVMFDNEGAAAAAKTALVNGRASIVRAYIASCQDRIQAGKPPLPPSPRVQKIIEEDGIDLAAEGINLTSAGFKINSQPAELMEKMKKFEDNLAMLMEQNKLLQEQNKILKDQIGKPKEK